jgi:ADP-ribosylglycohydrolase
MQGGNGERDQGKGSLMRILPIGLVDDAPGDATLVEHAHLASRVTHGHPRCQVACALYVLVDRELLADESDPDAALGNGVERLRAVYAGQSAFASVLEELLAHRSNVRKWGGGWVFDSFWSAWEAFAQSASYRETIERAVGYGHDTDTTAVIAGGLAGIRWAFADHERRIPSKWLSALRGQDIVEGMLRRLLAD